MKLFEIAHASRVKSFNAVDTINILKQSCSKSLVCFNETPLYRGGDFKNIENGMGFGESYMGKSLRSSANTFNFYTLWMDNSPFWKDFPKRSKSFIGATSQFISGDYGEVSLMIPFDSAIITQCPSEDLWVSFMDKNGNSLDDINGFVAKAILFYFRETLNSKSEIPKTYSTLKALCTEITYKTLIKDIDHMLSMKPDLTPDDKFKYQAAAKSLKIDILEREYLKPHESLADMWDRVLNPDDFKLFKGSNYKMPGKKEIYIEGKCVFLVNGKIKQKDLKLFNAELKDYPNILKSLNIK